MQNISNKARVRILVAVDSNGKWTSIGYSDHTGKDNINEKEFKDWICIDDLNDDIKYSWVEADVPLPESSYQSIDGEVKPYEEE